MAHFIGHDRSQTLLLPESLDDYVAAENPVRFIEAFVDSLDLAAAGFARVQPKATGRLGYAPADLLKLYIYGYLNRTRSSSRLQAHSGFPPHLSQGLPPGVPPIRAAVPRVGFIRQGVARRRRHPDQGCQQ